PEIASYPRFGLAVRRSLYVVSRDRTHLAWVAPVAGADATTAVTTIDGGGRLHGAPGIPIALLDQGPTETMRTPIERATGSGGAIELSTLAGSNMVHGSGTVVVGLDRRSDANGGGELFAGGPLVEDAAWFAAGLVATRATDSTIGTAGLAR